MLPWSLAISFRWLVVIVTGSRKGRGAKVLLEKVLPVVRVQLVS